MERSNEVRTEPQGADAGDQAILEGADRAGPGNHEMSDRPRQVPQIPPYWPIPLLPSSKINSELQNVVNVAGPVQERFARHQSYVGVAQSREIIAVSALGAHRKSCLKRHRVKEDSLRACLESSPQPNEEQHSFYFRFVCEIVEASNFQPADFFTLASYLLQQRLRRLLRSDDVVIHHHCGQWVMRVNELQMELTVHADNENMAKQLLYAMLALRLKLGGEERTVSSGKKKRDKHAAVGNPKKKEGNSTSAGKDATKKLVDDMIRALESDIASRPYSIGSLAAVAANNDSSKTPFGVRFRWLHRGKFKSWVEKNIPGITIHKDNTLSYSRSSESYRTKKKSRR